MFFFFVENPRIRKSPIESTFIQCGECSGILDEHHRFRIRSEEVVLRRPELQTTNKIW